MATKNSPETLSAPALRPVRYDDSGADTPIAIARDAILSRGIRRVRGVTPSNPGVREEHPAVCTFDADGVLVAARMVTGEDLAGLAAVLSAGVRAACCYDETSAFEARGWGTSADAGRACSDRLARVVSMLLLQKHPALHGASYVATLARGDQEETRALAMAHR